MEYFFGFVLLLGVLVFIHELGHFLVAKYYGVRVETFSIGMGKKIWSHTRGETEYALSLFPLGGYVKLTGQDPRETVPPELEHRSFRSKPIYQRSAVVLAGPLANALLAIGVFFGLYLNGVPSPGAILERVLKGSESEKAGLISGDKVVRIRSTSNEEFLIRDLSDLETAISQVGTQNQITMSVERENPSTGRIEIVDTLIQPVLGQERDSTLGVVQTRPVIPGVERNALASVVTFEPDSWAEKKGFPSHFLVTKIGIGPASSPTNFKEISKFDELSFYWNHFSKMALETQSSLFVEGQIVEIKEEASNSAQANAPRTPESKTLEFQTSETDFAFNFANTGLLNTENLVISISPNSPAEKMGLKSGDRVLTLNGNSVLSFSWFKTQIQEIAKNPDAVVKIEWLRGKEKMSAEVTPHQVEAQDPLTEVKKNQFQVGAAFLALPAPATMVTVKATGIIDALKLGWSRTVRLTQSMLYSFYHLAVGDISPKTLGGPLLIAKISGESIKQGATSFFRMMAFISLNLFILNLFPIPVLDGGHLVLFMVEAIRRKPLSIKVIEVWTTAGFFLLMSLVAVVFFNDLSRLGLFKFFKS